MEKEMLSTGHDLIDFNVKFNCTTVLWTITLTQLEWWQMIVLLFVETNVIVDRYVPSLIVNYIVVITNCYKLQILSMNIIINY